MPVTPEQARAELARRRALRARPQVSRDDYLAGRAAERDRYRAGPVDVAPFVDPIATEENRADAARGLARGAGRVGDWSARHLLLQGRDALPRLRAPAPMSNEEFGRYAGHGFADEIVIQPASQDREARNRGYRSERRDEIVRGARRAAGDFSRWTQRQMMERPGLRADQAVAAELGEQALNFLREPWRAYEDRAQARDAARYEGDLDAAADQALAGIGNSALAGLTAWPGSAAVRGGGRMVARGLPRVMPRSGGGSHAGGAGRDALALGAWTGAGAIAASGGAQAREIDPETQQQLEQARAELQSQQEQIRRFEDLSARAANDPGAARELQAIIGAVPDGRFGPQTAAAARARADQMRNDLGEMERRRQNLEESQMMARVSVTPEEEAQRELLLTSGAAAGALLGKYGLPIPTRLPFFGRFSGALGRSGTARHVRERLAERVGRAEAVQFMERPFGRRSLNQDQRAAERAATVNDFWREGLESGDQARVPFLMGSSEAQRPLANRNARSASQLFQPPRFSGEDFGYMAMGGLDAGIAGALLPGAQQKLEDAERAFESDRSEVNLRAVEEARASVTRLEIALRVGAGYIGGRVVGGYTDHYAGAPRPRNLRAAEAEQGRISRYVAPAEQRSRGRPRPR